MAYLSAIETDQLFLPSNADYWVRMKKRVEYGDHRRAQSAMLQITPTTGAPGANGNSVNGDPDLATLEIADVEVGAFLATLTLSMITEWNLTDEQDKPLPLSLQNLDRLDPEDGDYLSVEAQKRLKKRSESDQRPFGKRSGQRATGTRRRTPKPTG